MNRYFSDAALLQMREAIAEAGGNEVFFLGRTDQSRIVIEAEPLARGNRDAVAAIMVATSFGDVVIHNHPSGRLTPSQADLEIASIIGNQGVGFYIVDNRVERCYQVVSPFSRPEVERLSYPEIERWYTPGGVLSSGLAGYEHREEQSRMAFAVAEAFNDNKVAVIEAGTGTGKSLAYLLPSVLWALRNRERVVISTNTINLQEQLTKKDIPFLQKQGALEFRAVLVKGRSNYLCLRKVGAVADEPALFKDEGTVELESIIEWSRSTGSGCRSDLSFIPRDEAWEEVCCEADQCGRVKCPHYSRCFFYTARREAASADLLVVNHALLMADVAVRQEKGYASTAILPPFDRLIFDEGHHLEDVATSHLSAQVSRQGLLKQLNGLQHPRKHAARPPPPAVGPSSPKKFRRRCDQIYLEISGLLETALLPKKLDLADAVTRRFDAVALGLLEHLKGSAAKEQKLRLVPEVYGTPFWFDAEQEVRALVDELVDYTAALNAFLKACRLLPDRVLDKMAVLLVDLKGIKGRLEGTAEQLLFFIGREQGFCRWFDKSGRRGRVCGCGSAVPPGSGRLHQAGAARQVQDHHRHSATLAVGDRFDYLEARTGIGLLDRSRVTEMLLELPPLITSARRSSASPPTSPIPREAVPGSSWEKQLLQALAISQGRAFILFTSYDLLGWVFSGSPSRCKARDHAAPPGGTSTGISSWSASRRKKNAVLFATDSFWEGVDVQGKALELVVITRLPFRVPTEPVLAARAEHIAAEGGDPFMEYTVPQAVIKFKQGFGRLIRSRDDRGAVLICDSRVLTKNYGGIFLNALPGVRMVKGSGAEVFTEMERFFHMP